MDPESCFEDGDNIRLQKEGMFVNEYAAWNVFETSTNYPTIFEEKKSNTLLARGKKTIKGSWIPLVRNSLLL